MTKQLDVIAKSAGIVIIGMIASKGFSYLWRLVIARLGTDLYGTFSLGLAILGIATPIALIGLNAGVLRFTSFYYGKKDKSKIKGIITCSLRITLLSSVLIGILIFLSADYIAINLFNEPDLILVLKIMAFALPFYVLTQVFISAIKALQKIQYNVLSIDIIDNLLKIILAGLFVFFGYRLLGISIAYVFATIITFFLIGCFFEFRVFSILRTNIKSVFINNELFKYSIPLMLGGIMSTQMRWIDSLIIGFFLTSSDVGIYNAALPTAMLLLIIPTAILSLFLPIITAEYARNEIKKIKYTYITVTKWVTLSGIPLFLTMFLFSKPILTLLFGPDYASGALVLSILALGWFTFSICWPSSFILNMVKKTKLLLYITSIGFVITLSLNWILVPIYGIVGAATATSTSFIIFSALYVYFAYKNIKIFPFDRRILVVFIFAIFTIYLVHSIILNLGFGLLIQGTIFIFMNSIYLFFIFRYRLVGKEEIRIFRKAINKIRPRFK